MWFVPVICHKGTVLCHKVLAFVIVNVEFDVHVASEISQFFNVPGSDFERRHDFWEGGFIAEIKISTKYRRNNKKKGKTRKNHYDSGEWLALKMEKAAWFLFHYEKETLKFFLPRIQL